MSIIIIGAGFGGLSAAIRLAAAGKEVLLLEASGSAGGKAGEITVDGLSSDTGPSVLTMAEEAIELLQLADDADLVQFRTPSPGFRYLYADGTVLDVHHELQQTTDNIRSVLGDTTAKEFENFMHYSKQIWDGSAPHFIHGEAPNWLSILRLAITHPMLIPKMDPLRSMRSSIRRQITSPHLRMLMERYATYNGSDPRQAPATLNCIAHVELALGGYGVNGGIKSLVNALTTVAEKLGVQFRYNQAVQRIEVQSGSVCAVVTQAGERIPCTHIVANADAAQIAKHLLGRSVNHGIKCPTPYSMSGWTGVIKAKRNPEIERVAHTVLFPSDYNQEFADIFDRNQPPDDPTVYICSQSECHNRPGTEEHQALFVMVNAPPEPEDGATSFDVWKRVENTVLKRLHDNHLLTEGDHLIWTRSPTQLAEQFPGSRGAIYGAASNNRFAAFQRPANRIASVSGLYLASGSAHPGGGMPLAMISGKAASQALLADISQ